MGWKISREIFQQWNYRNSTTMGKGKNAVKTEKKGQGRCAFSEGKCIRHGPKDDADRRASGEILARSAKRPWTRTKRGARAEHQVRSTWRDFERGEAEAQKALD